MCRDIFLCGSDEDSDFMDNLLKQLGDNSLLGIQDKENSCANRNNKYRAAPQLRVGARGSLPIFFHFSFFHLIFFFTILGERRRKKKKEERADRNR